MNTNENNIAQLLEKFIAGDTTRKEEQILGDYFRTGGNIPQEWEPYRMMFEWFDNGMTKEPQPRRRLSQPHRSHSLRWLAAACVGLLIVIGATVWLMSDRGKLPQTAEVQENDNPMPSANAGEDSSSIAVQSPSAIAKQAPSTIAGQVPSAIAGKTTTKRRIGKKKDKTPIYNKVEKENNGADRQIPLEEGTLAKESTKNPETANSARRFEQMTDERIVYTIHNSYTVTRFYDRYDTIRLGVDYCSL